MTRPLPPSADPVVRATAAASARRYAARLRSALTNRGPDSGRHSMDEVPLTGRQRLSRDAWLRAGLSRRDAVLAAVQLGGRR